MVRGRVPRRRSGGSRGASLHARQASRAVSLTARPSPLALFCEVLRRGQIARLRAHGGSMLPFLRSGDVLTIAPVSGSVLAVGDVACYTKDDALYVHRVVGRDAQGLVLRGDALTWTHRVTAPAVLGRVTAVERNGRQRSLDTRRQRCVARLIVLAAPLVRQVLPHARTIRRLVRRG